MKYELAKKLKDAGYPQEYNPKYDIGGGGAPGSDIRIPTLSELIEACGDGLNRLERNPYWGKTPEDAVYFIIPEHKIAEKTPEEAVANLWLKLNEKS